jgi:hypothetical protein
MKKIKGINNRKTQKGTELGSEKNDNSIREKASVWPENHEEQRSMDIRMKEQLFQSSKKGEKQKNQK